MSVVSSAISELRATKSALDRKLYGFLFRDVDIWRQSRRLANYTTDISGTLPGSPTETRNFAVFVYYEPQAVVSNSVKRAIEALRRQGVNTILVCNHGLTDGQLFYFRDRCHSILLRNNQGYDFGAYKDAISHLAGFAADIGRVLLLNDSVFYATKGLDRFVENLLGEADLIGAFENWGEDHHLNSFAVSVSGHVFASGPFQTFWRDYIPVSNRIHAIENGEKKLTRAALASARHSSVIYPVAALYETLLQVDIDPADLPIQLPNPWRLTIPETGEETVTRQAMANRIANIMNVTSPIHAGSYFFPKFLDCPILKKDIVYRGRFKYWEVETWIHEILGEEEAAEYLTTLRKKGDSSKLGRVDRKRFNVGVK